MENARTEREQSQPKGFVVNRWVLASDDRAVASRAFAKVKHDLVRMGLDPENVALAVEEMSVAPWMAIFQRKQGFVFY